MTLKCVLVVLLLCCSLGTCQSQNSEKIDVFTMAKNYVGSFFSEFSDVSTQNITKQDRWKNWSHTHPKGHGQQTNNSTSGEDSVFVHVFGFALKITDCILESSTCDFEYFRNIFHKYVTTNFQNKFPLTVNCMRIISQSPFVWLNWLVTCVLAIPKTHGLMFVLQGFVILFGVMIFSMKQFVTFIRRTLNKNETCQNLVLMLLCLQRFCAVALLALGVSEKPRRPDTLKMLYILLCLGYASWWINRLLRNNYSPNVLLFLTIVEQSIYCRILENLFTCNGHIVCLASNLICLAWVFICKGQLWTYAKQNVELPKLSQLNPFAVPFLLLQMIWVGLKTGYRMGYFPLLYMGRTDNWVTMLLSVISHILLPYTFFSSSIWKLSFMVLSLIQRWILSSM